MKKTKIVLLFLVVLILFSCDRKPDLPYRDACAHPDALKEIKYYVKHKISDADGLLIAAEKNTNEKIVKELLKSKNIEEKEKYAALWTSLDNKNIEVFKVLLKATKGENTYQNNTNTTILMRACEKDKTDIVKLLIKNGADVNAQDKNGKTALMLTCEKGNEDIVKLLIKAGSDIKIKNKDDATAFIIAYGSVPQNKEIIDALKKAGSDEKEVNDYYTRMFKMVPIPGRNYEMMSTEVTQKLYKIIMGENPSEFKGDNNPVECVSWYDAVKFCNVFSQKLGLTPVYTINGNNVSQNSSANGFRLPTEAEWEYAAKGGHDYTYSGSNTIDEVAWDYDNSGRKTHPVAQKKANGYGLYDMSGNVWEWCWDVSEYDNDYRCIRGGGWWYSRVSDDYCGVSYGCWGVADSRRSENGFRLVRIVK